MYIYIYIYTYIHMYLSIYLSIYLYMYIYIYIYIYMFDSIGFLLVRGRISPSCARSRSHGYLILYYNII